MLNYCILLIELEFTYYDGMLVIISIVFCLLNYAYFAVSHQGLRYILIYGTRSIHAFITSLLSRDIEHDPDKFKKL